MVSSGRRAFLKSLQHELSRREALKVLAGVAGGVALSFVPKKWETPVVSLGVLPAHAQVSPTPSLCDGDLCAIARTTTLVEGEYGDFDFSACTPNGYYVWGGDSADGMTSSEDNIDFDPNVDNETLNIGAGAAVNGVYSLYLEHYEFVPLAMTVRIITAAGVFEQSLTLSDDRAVADVTFPGGTVTWRSTPGIPSCLEGRAGLKAK